MREEKCEECGRLIVKAPDGEQITGCEHYPDDFTLRYMRGKINPYRQGHSTGKVLPGFQPMQPPVYSEGSPLAFA